MSQEYNMDYSLLLPNQNSVDQQPDCISVLFDFEEVIRIENGALMVHRVLPEGFKPQRLQIVYDDKLVYECLPYLKTVSLNLLPICPNQQ